ncbi:Uncharacterized protein FKW44_012975 [Caligus rogercresseyi]|uniref:Uncharacterized protein n=1 Tax=Caligus rogercresseyi TaxID=217165 RepID=A0A7T8K976_CALRO|nr:Uncharacterized protein FKW44_012975 [Caligus rogercresseyi]
MNELDQRDIGFSKMEQQLTLQGQRWLFEGTFSGVPHFNKGRFGRGQPFPPICPFVIFICGDI